jgi:hypothetical protein
MLNPLIGVLKKVNNQLFTFLYTQQKIFYHLAHSSPAYHVYYQGSKTTEPYSRRSRG